jgi:lipid A 3-O-deacylase
MSFSQKRIKASAKIYAFILLIVFTIPLNKSYAEEPDLISVGVSYFNVTRQKQNALEGRFEFRSGLKIWEMKTFTGVMVTSAGAVYTMAGFYFDVSLTDRLKLTPSFAPGYFSKGNGIDLAHKIEFRSQLEISYIFHNYSRLGLSFSHISNANLGESNPGAESIAINYSIPLRYNPD